MPTPPVNPPTPVQLRLPTGDAEPGDVTAALNQTALRLLKIRVACELLHDIADRSVVLDDDNIEQLRGALNALDGVARLPGRLGYLTRALNSGPVTNYGDIVDDLAFAIHLNDPHTP